MTQKQSLALFERWFKTAIQAQRVHEEESDEYDVVSIAGDARSRGVTFSKELQKGLVREYTPGMAPQGPAGPGGMGGSTQRRVSRAPSVDKTMKPKPPKDSDKS